MTKRHYLLYASLIIFAGLMFMLFDCAPAPSVIFEPVTMESVMGTDFMNLVAKTSRIETKRLQNEPVPKGPVRVGMSIRDVINIKGAPLMVSPTGYGPLRYGTYYDFYAVEFLYSGASVIIRHTKVTKITRIP